MAMIASTLVGCGGGGAEVETEDPFRESPGEEGRIYFQLNAEAPLVQGSNDVLVTVHALDGHVPVVGADVDVSAVMPAMGHAAPEATSIDDRGGGIYFVRGLSLTMAGRWDVHVTASQGDVWDEVHFTYDVR